MASPVVYHVVPHPLYAWSVKREGADCATFFAARKRDAIRRGRRLARFMRGRLTIHRANGNFEAVDSYTDVTPPTVAELLG